MSYLPARTSLKAAYEKYLGNKAELNKQIMPYQFVDNPEKLDNTVESLVLTDFNDDLHGINELQEPLAKYKDMVELCELDEDVALAKLKLTEPPLKGEDRLCELKQELASKGIITIRDMLRNYLGKAFHF